MADLVIDNTPELVDGLAEFRAAFGEFGGIERRYAHVANLETRDNGDPDSLFSTTGRAIVFDSYSLDLGGFKEEIAPEAVRAAMEAEDADYHLLWDHDTTLVLARNKNGTLKAEIAGDQGVDFWGRVAKTSYAADLRVLMDRGDIDECSFAFTIDPDEGEEWRLEDDGTIVRRVTKIKRLWDLTICARGAYPDTNSATVRSMVVDAARVRRANSILEEAAAPDADERALQPGLVAWDDEQGFCDISCDIECALEEGEDSYSVYWWVVDINVRDGGSEAVVCHYEYGEGASYFLITGITYDDTGEPVIPDPSSWTGVTMKWVAIPTEVIVEEGEGVVIVMNTASDAHQRIQRLIREADLRFAAELEARHAEPETRTDLEEIPAPDDAPIADAPTDKTPDDAPEDDTPADDEPEADEERKHAAALARARGRAALAA